MMYYTAYRGKLFLNLAGEYRFGPSLFFHGEFCFDIITLAYLYLQNQGYCGFNQNQSSGNITKFMSLLEMTARNLTAQCEWKYEFM